GGEQGGALALGEAVLAGAANEHQAALFAVAEADAEVVPAAQAIVGAGGGLAAKAAEGAHEQASQGGQRQRGQRPPVSLCQPRPNGNRRGTLPIFGRMERGGRMDDSATWTAIYASSPDLCAFKQDGRRRLSPSWVAQTVWASVTPRNKRLTSFMQAEF